MCTAGCAIQPRPVGGIVSEQPLLVRTPEPVIILAPRKPRPDPELLARVCEALKRLPCQS
jgi:hypothetical protein